MRFTQSYQLLGIQAELHHSWGYRQSRAAPGATAELHNSWHFKHFEQEQIELHTDSCLAEKETYRATYTTALPK
jgi:hypothetical protein